MTAATARPDSAIDRAAGAPQGLTLAIAGFLPVLTILSLAPAVPSLMGHFAGVPNANILVPLMVTAPGLMVALLAPFAGGIVDRYGRRKLILASTLAYAIAGLLPLLAHDLPTMFASRLVVGVAEAFILIIVNALFADYYTVERRRTWITVQGLTGPILGTGSIALAGAFTALVWNGAFAIYAAALPILLAMFAFLFEPRRAAAPTSEADNPAPAATGEFPVRTAVAYCGVTLFCSVIYYVFIVQSGLAFKAIGVGSSANLGLLIGAASLGTPIGAALFNILSRKLAGVGLVAVLLTLLGLGMIGMGLSPNIQTMAAFGFLQQIGAGLTVTALIFWVSRLLPPEHRGRGFGYWSSAFFAGQFLSPLAVGAVQSAVGGILATFLTMGVIGLVGAIVLVVARGVFPKPVQ